MLQFCSLHYFSNSSLSFPRGTLVILHILAATGKGCNRCPEGAVVTEERITFWILVTPLHPGPRPRLMHDASPHVHSERGLAMRRRLPRKSLTVTACHWVVKGHLPPSWSEAFLPFAWGGTWKDGQCCGMNRALLLCYYSVQVLEPFSPKQWKQKQKPKAESEDNNFFVFCLVRW